MNPRRFGHADARLYDVDEGRGVVVSDLLAFVDFGHEFSVNHRTTLAQFHDLAVGKNASFSETLGGQ